MQRLPPSATVAVPCPSWVGTICGRPAIPRRGQMGHRRILQVNLRRIFARIRDLQHIGSTFGIEPRILVAFRDERSDLAANPVVIQGKRPQVCG